jgi:hypothetical protein
MWHKARVQLSQVGPVGPTSLVGLPGVGAISISALPMCQGGLVHGIFDAQSWWKPSWVVGQPRV